MLGKTRQELTAMIPQSADSADLSQAPPIVALKEALAELDQISNDKDNVMKEVVAKMDELNVVEDLMLVHKKQADKNTVFAQNID